MKGKNKKKLLRLFNEFTKINKSFIYDIHKIHRNYLYGLSRSIDKFKIDLL